MKVCTKCKVEKPIEDFGKVPKSWCLACYREYARQQRIHNKEHVKELHKKSYDKVGREKDRERRRLYKETVLFAGAKFRAKQRGLPITISLEDIVIPDLCPLLGIPINRYNTLSNSPNAPSLDRVRPELGYVKGNVRVISYKANTVKNNLSEEQLKIFANNIHFYFQGVSGGVNNG